MEILVAEDPAGRQASLARGLRALGYTVDTAENETRAIACAREGSYDIIILDLMPPHESSLLVLHEIRESDHDVEILILSTQDQIHDRVTALIQGATDYLVKPFSFDELHARIQELVRHKVAQPSTAAAPGRENRGFEHTNRLIANLLENCSCELGPIELVISEIRLSELLQRVCAEAKYTSPRDKVKINLPQGKLPKLLTDARLMQRLLVKLVSSAIRHCPADAKIDIMATTDDGYCTIAVINPLASPISSKALKQQYLDFRKHDHRPDSVHSFVSLSLVRNFAECMNLGLEARLLPDDRFCVYLSSIKIT